MDNTQWKELVARLEPGVTADYQTEPSTEKKLILASIAISLKRIADELKHRRLIQEGLR